MIEAPMPFLVGLLRSHKEYVPSLSEDEMQNDDEYMVQKLVIEIDDEVKGVKIDSNRVELPIPEFKELE